MVENSGSAAQHAITGKKDTATVEDSNGLMFQLYGIGKFLCPIGTIFFFFIGCKHITETNISDAKIEFCNTVILVKTGPELKKSLPT